MASVGPVCVAEQADLQSRLWLHEPDVQQHQSHTCTKNTNHRQAAARSLNLDSNGFSSFGVNCGRFTGAVCIAMACLTLPMRTAHTAGSTPVPATNRFDGTVPRHRGLSGLPCARSGRAGVVCRSTDIWRSRFGAMKRRQITSVHVEMVDNTAQARQIREPCQQVCTRAQRFACMFLVAFGGNSG